MAKFCAKCGSSLEGAGKFCPSCGAQVMEEAAQGAPTPSKPQPNQQEMNSSPVQRQMPQPPPGQPQPMMYQNAPGQGAPNAAYGMGMMGAAAFSGEHYVPDEGIVQMFFRYDNRLNRKRYIMRGLALFFGLVVVCTAIGVVLALAGVDDSAIGVIGTLIGFASAIPGCMLAVRRLHDLDRPSWWIVGNFVPFVNCVLGLYLLFARGTFGPNQYGPDPLEGQY
ncbi:MAG: zinc-ribbon domain-containing protein [Schwartzia sp.]|nr:zinc-ribbon domain-containing protein [Schwartzia sp. (in: firmicutes)]